MRPKRDKVYSSRIFCGICFTLPREEKPSRALVPVDARGAQANEPRDPAPLKHYDSFHISYALDILDYYQNQIQNLPDRQLSLPLSHHPDCYTWSAANHLNRLSCLDRSRMDYYACQIGELRQETRRRGYTPLGTGDELSEGLKRDDEQRGADATTVKTEEPGQFIPQGLNQSRTAEFGQSAPAGLLANESVCAQGD